MNTLTYVGNDNDYDNIPFKVIGVVYAYGYRTKRGVSHDVVATEKVPQYLYII